MEHELPISHQDNEHEVIAHMSPAELETLSQVGGVGMDDQRGMPSLAPLLEILKHPACAHILQEMLQPGFADGGEVDVLNASLRRNGRMGDTMTAVIPRPIADLFDRVLHGGKSSRNQKDGKREYWFGGDLISSIGSKIANVVKPVTNALSPVGDFVQWAGPKINPFLTNYVTPAIGAGMQAAAPIAGAAATAGLKGIAARYGGGAGGDAIAGAAGDTVSDAIGGLGHGIGTNFKDSNPIQILQDSASKGLQNASPGVGQVVGDKLEQYAPAAGQFVGKNIQETTNQLGMPDSQGMGRDSQNYTTNAVRGIARNAGHDVGNALTDYAAKFHSKWKPSPMGYADGGAVPSMNIRSTLGTYNPTDFRNSPGFIEHPNFYADGGEVPSMSVHSTLGTYNPNDLTNTFRQSPGQGFYQGLGAPSNFTPGRQFQAPDYSQNTGSFAPGRGLVEPIQAPQPPAHANPEFQRYLNGSVLPPKQPQPYFGANGGGILREPSRMAPEVYPRLVG